MKKFILSTLLFISLSLTIHSQNANLSEKDIVGRWIETERIEGDQVTKISDDNDTYIFRENLIFHKGESSEGLIIFNITGKYSVEEKCITILYKDYMNKAAKNQKPKTMKFEVLSMNNDKDEIIVNIQDYNYEYQMKLKRQ